MFQALRRYAAQLLSVGGFRVTQLPRKVYNELLTAFSQEINKPVVFLKPLLTLAQLVQGCLIVDDTSNPKYGLAYWTRTLFIPSMKGYRSGYKIVLFLWQWKYGTFPIGFALWHAKSPKLTDLFLEGLSQLRNHFGLRPETVLFDGAYFSNEIAKRLDDYGWSFTSRFSKGRNLSGISIRQQIPRGYGQAQGTLDNGVKLNVVRRKGYFIASNRMLWTAEKILRTYKSRWKVEECFRVLKSCLKLDGCQQHSMQAQAIYLCVCLLLCASQALHLDRSPYVDFYNIVSGKTHLYTVLSEPLIRLAYPM